MRFTGKALLGAFLLGSASLAMPAAAQQQGPNVTVSGGARASVKALQDAVKAKNFATINDLIAAANAKATTPGDRYAVGRLTLDAGIETKNDALMAAGIEAMLASNLVPAEQLGRFRLELGRIKFRQNDIAGTIATVEPVLAANPADVDSALLLSDSYNKLKRHGDAYAALQKAIAARRTAGQPVPADWLRQAFSLSYNGNLPTLQQSMLDYVKAQPTPSNFRDAARVYAEANKIPNTDQLDLYRLQHAAGALKGESDFYNYANAALLKGFPGEAKAVLDEGFASGAINKTRPIFRDVYASASSKAAADRAALPATEKSGLGAPTARQALVSGDVFFGYGDYAKAAALYRAALTKSGADKDLINLRLGMALARAGDKAGATAALNAVGGAQRPVAQLWQIWASSRS